MARYYLCLTKPFSPRELVLRVAAILRWGRAGAMPDGPVSYGLGLAPANLLVVRGVAGVGHRLGRARGRP